MSIVKHNLIGASGQGGYFIDRSLRFRSSASAYLSRTPASASNQKTWTWSGWVKRGKIGSGTYTLFGSGNSNTNFGSIYFNYSSTTDDIEVLDYPGASSTWLKTNALYRDVSAWYHVVVAYDTTQATSSNRVKLYVNGEQVTSFASAAYPTQNSDSRFNSTLLHTVGAQSAAAVGGYFDGYMTEINFIDGQALEPTDFGEFDDITGVWKPKKYVGSYGTNGFYLNFGDPTSTVTLCADQSGTGNDWTAANISLSSGVTYDSMEDVPTLTGNTAANYATLNPLMLRGVGLDVAQGNLYANRNSAGWGNIAATIGVSSGKWYWEFLNDSTAATMVGVDSELEPTDYVGHTSTGYGYYALTGNKYNNRSSSSYGNTYTTGDIVGFALDMDNGKIWFAKNGAWQASGDPVAGTNEAFSGLTGTYFPQFSFNNSGGDGYVNFGQRPFAYTPPTGFKALNTYNLPDSDIIVGAEQFNTVLYTGNGSTQSITGVNFQPDAVWIKSRSQVSSHGLHDALRLTAGGNPAILYPNDTAAESSGGRWLNTLDSDGFTLNSNTAGNNSGSSYVAWNWKANGSGVSNTVGDTNATVSANTTSGFSIVSFNAGTAGNHTVGHGLGVTPNLIIMKDRDSSGYGNWSVFHSEVCTSTSNYLLLNGTGGLGSVANSWGSALPTSTVFGFGSNVNIAANDDIISYCFANIEGFSAFGKYIGNGSTDGPFIYTGFRPAWVMVKRTSSSGTEWVLFDDKRDTYNEVIHYLFPSSSAAESTATAYYGLDFVSNGFKWRKVHTPTNSSGATYIYAAFAENPFKNALAR